MAKQKAKGLSTTAKKWLIGIGIGAMVLVIGAMGVKLSKLDKTEQLSAAFGYEQGLLSDTDGEEVKGTTSIRSKDYISVDGFTADLKEDASIVYKLFFYGEENVFISATQELSVDYSGEIPEGAESVRVMITPTNDPEVSALEMAGYASQLTVEWNK